MATTITDIAVLGHRNWRHRVATRELIHKEEFATTCERVFALLVTPSAIRQWWSAARAIVIPEMLTKGQSTRRLSIAFVVALGLFAISAYTRADDWPEFLGPEVRLEVMSPYRLSGRPVYAPPVRIGDNIYVVTRRSGTVVYRCSDMMPVRSCFRLASFVFTRLETST